MRAPDDQQPEPVPAETWVGEIEPVSPVERGAGAASDAGAGSAASARRGLGGGLVVMALGLVALGLAGAPEAAPEVEAPSDGAPCALRLEATGLACVERAGAAPPLPGAVALALGAPLELNLASAEALQRLRGIGPRRVEAIMALREARGGLCRLEELADVRGIGPATVARLRPSLAVRVRPARCARERQGR